MLERENITNYLKFSSNFSTMSFSTQMLNLSASELFRQFSPVLYVDNHLHSTATNAATQESYLTN